MTKATPDHDRSGVALSLLPSAGYCMGYGVGAAVTPAGVVKVWKLPTPASSPL
ncbi:hypothetical protein SAMN05444157_1071 [Frankineae bacterium MT45]|nr:hypothetical protein SAMN05444157_1071 [Frankineae bacterium MT45]